MKKSTKKTKKGAAMTEATRLEALELKSSTTTGEKASQAYAILSEAADAAAKGELSEAKARLLVARLCEISTGEVLKFYTVRSWSADWLSAKKVTKKATQERYKTSVKLFLAWLDDKSRVTQGVVTKAEGKLEAVTKANVRDFRDAIREGWLPRKDAASKEAQTKNPEPNAELAPPRTGKTTNQYARDIASMFRAAVTDGVLIASPCAGLGRVNENDSIVREVFTIAEIAKLAHDEGAGDGDWQNAIFSVKNLTEETRSARCIEWQGMTLVGFYIGARIGDCAGLKWSNVNFALKTITYMPAKTDGKQKIIEVPIHPCLLTWLEARVPAKKNGPIFPTLFTTSVSGNVGLSKQFVAIMDHAKIHRGTTREAVKGRKALHARSFHALRHSLTSILADADVAEEVRRGIVGHDTAEAHLIYTHLHRKTLARAIEKVPGI